MSTQDQMRGELKGAAEGVLRSLEPVLTDLVVDIGDSAPCWSTYMTLRTTFDLKVLITSAVTMTMLEALSRISSTMRNGGDWALMERTMGEAMLAIAQETADQVNRREQLIAATAKRIEQMGGWKNADI